MWRLAHLLGCDDPRPVYRWARGEGVPSQFFLLRLFKLWSLHDEELPLSQMRSINWDTVTPVWKPSFDAEAWFEALERRPLHLLASLPPLFPSSHLPIFPSSPLPLSECYLIYSYNAQLGGTVGIIYMLLYDGCTENTYRETLTLLRTTLLVVRGDRDF